MCAHADEIDAVGTKRYDAHSGGEREIQRTMLELLNQLDGFDALTDVKVGACGVVCGGGRACECSCPPPARAHRAPPPPHRPAALTPPPPTPTRSHYPTPYLHPHTFHP